MRDSVTAEAAIASQAVNFVLVPDVPFKLENFLYQLEKRMRHKSHAIIAVAKGAGQDLLDAEASDCDPSGKVKLEDIGLFLRSQIESHFRKTSQPVVIRYFSSRYQIRSRPVSCHEARHCDCFALNAVHAAMAGKTGLIIGSLHERFIHVPIQWLSGHDKQLDPEDDPGRSVLAATGPPAHFR